MIGYKNCLKNEESLDPSNWDEYRTLAHSMVDDIFSFLSTVGEQKVWQKTPVKVIDSLKQPLPLHGQELTTIYDEFKENILPYRKGNIHPMYFSWVEGNGTITGVLADMLASAMNSNLGIGDHSAIYVEHQVINWCKEIVGYPLTSSGILVSGGSIANITALIIARNGFKDGIIKKRGLKDIEDHLVVYCSTETHNCLFKAVETIGTGTDYLRIIPVNKGFQIDLDELEKQISLDKENGLTPFCIIGSAGTVNTGALDPLNELSAIAQRESMWFHVDGAIGAVLHLLPEYHHLLKGMYHADSIAFDLHKWLYINYEAGCVLVRDAAMHKTAFAQQASYLSKHERGLSSGPDSFSSYGLELSRGFKSLKIWMNIKEHGIEKFGRLIRQNIAQAMYMEDKIKQTPHLEMLTPVTLNIICYRFNPGGLSNDQLNIINKEILMRMQEQGIAAPSYTVLHGNYSIRLSITNHRTVITDLDKVIAATIDIGNSILNKTVI